MSDFGSDLVYLSGYAQCSSGVVRSGFQYYYILPQNLVTSTPPEISAGFFLSLFYELSLA